MVEFVFCTLVIGFVEVFFICTYFQIRDFIEDVIYSIEEKRFNKLFYLDHVEIKKDDNYEYPILMGVYKRRA